MDTEQRLQKILQGAFSGPPTPLKNIPTRNGVSRRLKRKKRAEPPRKVAQKKKKPEKIRALIAAQLGIKSGDTIVEQWTKGTKARMVSRQIVSATGKVRREWRPECEDK